MGALGSIAWKAINEFFADGCTKLAAAMAYYALFALFPLAILAVTAFGLIASSEAARADTIDAVLDLIPLREDRGRAELEQLLTDVTEDAQVSGAIGLVTLVISASGAMGAVRFSLNTVWDVEDERPPLRGKALDILLVAGAGLALAASLGLTILVQTASAIGGAVGLLAGQLAPALLAFGVFAVIFTVVPASNPRFRDVWPGALVGALAYAATKILFAIYLRTLADFAAVYASLATVIAFLLFAFISANGMLLGAEVAATWRQALAEREAGADEDEEAEPIGRRLISMLRGTVVRPPSRSAPERAHDDEDRDGDEPAGGDGGARPRASPPTRSAER